ncbi:hypothetical protein KVR01_011966 [Diaporthe batatas]|uniref:uncharacterized protein n=1 Tax=Diaporthe batatas TaxID=748121 RepID=UPI001D057560|nr:uncharacterized protein KVR01_011966 [Diaporthe batatas]KAG8158205.1 hypothetical protein KVR01_011966 [Diaporthe batatas]
MFATLLEEIATLRRQNEDQQRQLEHLRGATSLLLERDSVSLPTPGRLQFKHLPLEIREMIWKLAVPRRLLGFPGSRSDVPSALPIPTIAHVCRESRRVFMTQKRYTKDGRNYVPPPLWRLKGDSLAHWTSFSPRTDALLINPGDFLREDIETNYPITWTAEHLMVENAETWEQLRFSGRQFDYEEEKALTDWIGRLAMFPNYSPPIRGSIWSEAPRLTRAPVCHVRTVDFIVSSITMVDHNYPPNLVHRLFGGDYVRIVDLRDREAVDAIEHMIQHELSQFLEPSEYTLLPTDLEDSLDIFKGTATESFSRVEKRLLRALAKAYYTESLCINTLATKARAILPSLFRDGKWDMEVTWAKELCKRIDVRPVHVFIRAEGVSEVNW